MLPAWMKSKLLLQCSQNNLLAQISYIPNSFPFHSLWMTADCYSFSVPRQVCQVFRKPESKLADKYNFSVFTVILIHCIRVLDVIYKKFFFRSRVSHPLLLQLNILISLSGLKAMHYMCACVFSCLYVFVCEPLCICDCRRLDAQFWFSVLVYDAVCCVLQ